ncbi:LDL-receptor class A domain-containing protein 2 Skeletal organic matrix MAM and [Collichthys lucidus]|uniref:LDL-receptor class A domain-containing protein 2 Skeletal organic matrix MAM and n=1 Tax=Collichthys lucidus TaxID=240159 RepID=A0A4U5UWE3_COLLU|nr:LDL-receptor class A domain-containing protein 2 Skeletal organic matrix MAM and [Collichthys lucidus]
MKQVFVLLSVLSVLVSSCPDGELSCTSGECLPAGLVCDLKSDCESGSDQKFCGSCDFEHHSCGWNDTSDHWRRKMANITLIPGVDHTSGSASGHVMHLDGKSDSTAKLEYSVDRLAALGCQISFWYHMYENKSSSSSTSLKVTMVRDGDERDLLEISRTQTDGWENATAFIGNQPGGYKLQFSYRRSFLDTKDIMLDDISFDYCGDGEVPAGSDQLSCDFEKDTCSWYHDYTASLLWERSDGKYYGPTGNGYYMRISAKHSLNTSSAARLISFPRPAGQVICVSFFYHIFGNSIGSLKFIAKRSGEAETVVWMRSGTQGNKWRFADLTFESDKPIQFIIEAVVGGIQGSIAIDDITVSSSETGPCPAERECTFQGSLCGLTPDPSASFAWSRITGTSQPANSSGPATDHTLGTELGYYLSAHLWSHPVGSRGAIMTAVMEPTAPDGECLMFWYYMEGNEVGELSVYLQTTENSHSAPLWSRKGDQGRHWRHGRVTLLSSNSPYQVIFEAVVGDGPRRDIAIDDLFVLNGACPPPGHFAFFMPLESDREEIARLEGETMEAVDQACLEIWHNVNGWLSDGPSDIILTVFVNETAGLRPVWNTSAYRNGTWIRDRVDYNASEPHQIILQASCYKPTSVSDSLALDDVHIIRGKSCYEIIPTTTPNPATTTTAAPASAMDCTFEQGLCSWVQELSDDVNWTLSNGLQVDQPWDGPQYDHTVGNNQGFFLLLNGSGSKDEERAVVSVPVIGLTSHFCVGFWYHMLGPSVSTLDLLVETDSSEVLVWTRRGTQNPEWINAQVTINMSSTITRLMFTGHRGTNSRGFIAIDDITVREGACSTENACGFDSSTCGFESDVSHLGRWVHKRGTKYEADHTYGTENGEKKTVQQLQVESLIEQSIGVTTKEVHNVKRISCFYMTVMTSTTAQTEALLLTPELTSTEDICVRFWYWLPAGPHNTLSVHVHRNGEPGDALWQRSGAPSLGWEVAEVTVSSPTKFRVGFKAFHVPGTNTTVKLDDISARNGACSPPSSCDFESGQCTWVNIPKEGGHDWVLASGGFQGPATDHTTQTAEEPHQSSTSIVRMDPTERPYLLSDIMVPYGQQVSKGKMTNQHPFHTIHDSGTLKVYKRSGASEEDLMFSGNSSGCSWTRFSQSVETNNKPFQLLIEAESTNSGFIAIDDISVTPGLCQVNETSLGFVGCYFENGTCGWKDISVGQFQWMRGRNGSENHGPSVDHTVGTELGWYMAVKPERGDQMSPAAVQSPTMKQASAACTLHFYYNMFGEDVEELNVVLRERSRTTTLLWLSGNHGDFWHHGEVTVGRLPQDFVILFEGSGAFNKPGHIAIDDVDFTNCTLPGSVPALPAHSNMQDKKSRFTFIKQFLVSSSEPQLSCPENMFTCNNSVCVEHNLVCDFSDDCGDESDESNCVYNFSTSHSLLPDDNINNDVEQQGVVERCSFERDLCSWAESDVDTPGAKWTRHSGQEAWPVHGPHRDHTKNSAAGHYIIPVTEEGQTLEILSKTLLPSSNCTMRFFFFSLDDAAARLTVQSRTLQSGSDDTELWIRETSQSYSWRRAEITFSSSDNSKIVFRYEPGDGPRGLVALDDISFSRECVFDPDNNKLPDTSPTSSPPTSPATASTSTAPTNPCQDKEFFCWRSAECILATLQCDYHPDCPQGEDEDGCGPCTFENNQCQWTDISEGQTRWQRLKASNNTEPPTDHTTDTGYYIRVNFSQGSTQSEARLQSPTLSPSSPYCQILFHFHISAESAGSLRVLMQQAEGSEAILWSRSHNTVSYWTPEHLPLGLHQQSYKVWFSIMTQTNTADPVVAVDDISFVDCEKSYKPPALSACGCSFEDGLCVWVQGAEDELDWISRKFIYIESSPPSVKGNLAQLKSPLLPPAGEKGYCFTFWHHMFGATVGSFRLLLQTTDPLKKTVVWQKSGNQGDEWLLVQIHVTVQNVHQLILEATVGGEAGDIAIDDISLISGPCPASDMCDFEEGSCNWQQETTDDSDWVRQSGSTLNPNTGPDSDHTTNTPTGHYYYLSSSAADVDHQTAKMYSPPYPAGKGACVQLWYHMYGKGMGTLNVYQQSEGGKQDLIFSQTGDQGRLWKFAQASLLPRVQPYMIVVEGVKSGPTQEGDMAFDDVHLTDVQCPPPGHCDFETNMCSWSNMGGDVDQEDWLRGRGASPNPNTGPSVDHTTNSTHGYYLYVDSSVGEWGDMSFLTSDVFQPSTRGHCLRFWYHMYGDHVGTLRVSINDREMHSGGYEEGTLKWIETGNKGDKWQEANVPIKHKEPFWFVFVYQRGMNTGGDVALDDISIQPGGCYSDPPPDDDDNGQLSIGLSVGLTLLAGVVIFISVFMLKRKRRAMDQSALLSNDALDQNNVFDLLDRKIDGTQHGAESDFNFFQDNHDPMTNVTDSTIDSSDA